MSATDSSAPVPAHLLAVFSGLYSLSLVLRDPDDVASVDGLGGLASDQATLLLALTAMEINSELLIRRLREYAPACTSQFGVRSLRIFGSWARGTATANSDVDLLVSFDGPATAKRFYGLQLFLEDLLGRPIDLVTEEALREELRSSVEADAITL